MQRLDPALIELLEGWPFFDNAIVQHGFTPYLRDYDVFVDAVASVPGAPRAYCEGRYRFRFTHCVLAHAETAVADKSWRVSWNDVFVDRDAWVRAGEPSGYVWGVAYLEAGHSLDEFLDDFPSVRRTQAVAALEEAKRALVSGARAAG
jgi:hypothetical protein